MTITPAAQPTKPTRIDRSEARHGGAHAAGLLHAGIKFDAIIMGSDELCEIRQPAWTDDESVTARIALMGPATYLRREILKADKEMPKERIIPNILFTWKEDIPGPELGDSSDLVLTGGRVEAEIEYAYAFVVSNEALIELIADDFIAANGRLDYSAVARKYAGKTVEPKVMPTRDATYVFAGQLKPLRELDRSIKTYLAKNR